MTRFLLICLLLAVVPPGASARSGRAALDAAAGNLHNPGMLMVFLPKERVLIEADSFNAPNTPGGRPTAIPNLVHFIQAVDRLGLWADQLVGLHDRITTLNEARTAAETYGDSKSPSHRGTSNDNTRDNRLDDRRPDAGHGADVCPSLVLYRI